MRTLRMDSRLQNVPIVVYSEISEPSDVVLAYQIGANSFVKKPESLPEFSQLLHDLMDLGWLSEKGIGSSLKQTVPS
jgi:CheY-like chemotaxis protein